MESNPQNEMIRDPEAAAFELFSARILLAHETSPVMSTWKKTFESSKAVSRMNQQDAGVRIQHYKTETTTIQLT
jgi:hypothetical protein